MPRSCSICTSPARAGIEGALVAGDSARSIAALFRVSQDAVSRHKAAHLQQTLMRAAQTVAAVQVQQTDDAIDVMAELQACFRRVRKLLDACDLWLSDPADPTRYTLEPRADEVDIIYTVPGTDGKPTRKRDRLSTLLAKVNGVTVVRWETKHEDPRNLLLRTAAGLQGHLELLGELMGELKRNPTVNLVLAPEWVKTRTILMEALSDFPEARAAVARALIEVNHGA